MPYENSKKPKKTGGSLTIRKNFVKDELINTAAKRLTNQNNLIHSKLLSKLVKETLKLTILAILMLI